MKTLLTSLILAVTTFFASFAVLTLRSTRNDAAMFWQLERLSHQGSAGSSQSLNEFARVLRSRTHDPDLLVCAEYQLKRSTAMIRLNIEPSVSEDDAVAFGRLIFNGWRRPSGLLLLADAMNLEPAATTARLNCLQKFSGTDADRSNAIVAGFAALLVLPLVQGGRRFLVMRAAVHAIPSLPEL
jgi:hypothetical protein